MILEQLLSEPFALAMTPGFCRFFAHIGALDALDELNLLNYTHLAGASAGALVASFCCNKIKPRDMIKRLLPVEFKDVFDFNYFLGSFLKGEKFENLLEKNLLFDRFEESTVPIVITVYNIIKNQTEYISYGKISRAIRGSCTVPILFPPIFIEKNKEKEQALVIDGGVFDRAGLFGIKKSFENDLQKKISIRLNKKLKKIDEEIENYLVIYKNFSSSTPLSSSNSVSTTFASSTSISEVHLPPYDDDYLMIHDVLNFDKAELESNNFLNASNSTNVSTYKNYEEEYEFMTIDNKLEESLSYLEKIIEELKKEKEEIKKELSTLFDKNFKNKYVRKLSELNENDKDEIDLEIYNEKEVENIDETDEEKKKKLDLIYQNLIEALKNPKSNSKPQKSEKSKYLLHPPGKLIVNIVYDSFNNSKLDEELTYINNNKKIYGCRLLTIVFKNIPGVTPWTMNTCGFDAYFLTKFSFLKAIHGHGCHIKQENEDHWVCFIDGNNFINCSEYQKLLTIEKEKLLNEMKKEDKNDEIHNENHIKKRKLNDSINDVSNIYKEENDSINGENDEYNNNNQVLSSHSCLTTSSDEISPPSTSSIPSFNFLKGFAPLFGRGKPSVIISKSEDQSVSYIPSSSTSLSRASSSSVPDTSSTLSLAAYSSSNIKITSTYVPSSLSPIRKNYKRKFQEK